MGTLMVQQYVTAEARDDLPDDLGDWLQQQATDTAEQKGYHPTGRTRIEWVHITEADVILALAAQRDAGIEDPAVTYQPGDWSVFIRVDVTEDEPVE